jgi:hypothetical protein
MSGATTFLHFADGPMARLPPIVNPLTWPPPERIAVELAARADHLVRPLEDGDEAPEGFVAYHQVARSHMRPASGQVIGAEYALEAR